MYVVEREMIMKKRKRKHCSDHSDDNPEGKVFDDDKFKVYIKKSNKKSSSKDKKKKSKDSSESNFHNSLVKKFKKKKKHDASHSHEAKLEFHNSSSNTSTVSSVPMITKPEVNQATAGFNAVINNSTLLRNNMRDSPRQQNIQKFLSEPSKIEFSTLGVNISQEVNIRPDDGELLEIELSAADSREVDDLDTESKVTKAYSNKSEKSYNSQLLKNYIRDSAREHLWATREVMRTNSEEKTISILAVNKKEKEGESHQVQTDGLNSTNHQSSKNSDIVRAIKGFYDEMTGNPEYFTYEHTKLDKKKKAIVPVDNLVKDTDNLSDIVKKTVEDSDDSLPTNQSAQFFSLENRVILVLKPQTQFSFLGKLKLQVLYGAIKLYGSVFHFRNTAKPVEAYSPRGYSSLTMTTFYLDGAYDKEALWDALILEGVDRSLKTKLHDAVTECTDEWSVLLLENFENTLTNFLSNYCPLKLFPKIDNTKYMWCDSKRAECVVQANFQFCNSSNEISICPQWNEKVTRQLLIQWDSHKFLHTMIVGGKGVGKSTTARYLINSLLFYSKKIILLDLDPGQAEMTPAACMSLNVIDEPLLGPNFTHLKTPFYHVYLEDINVSNCITRYIECTKKLVEFYQSRKDLAHYPLIVNTMGFCKGIGLDICIFLIKLIEPSNVIQILSKRPKNNFEFALLNHTVNEHKFSLMCLNNDSQVSKKACIYELHYVPTMAEGKRHFETWNMEPRQQRELVLLSYLSQIIKNADDENFCNAVSNNINNIVPYELPFSSFYVTLIKSMISPTHILAAMNGNLVALCGIDLDDDTSQKSRECLKYPMVLIKPPPCTCYGFELARCINPIKSEVARWRHLVSHDHS
ncbi:polynucleotide 5'-hydroxyl-kinase NOL9 [Copidosoma floridanum]|uniref:polynucleotide 5'-hydroxyl-kinase NOL9 n=1 Tax=Copidosoma floridanum TaxID=29053 RepID=UPI0006C93E2F|nr:polynucleotide 5'-hydroxyl-kinase NOL9 [Copidosoma floridanum]